MTLPSVDAPEQAVILLLRQGTAASDVNAPPAGLIKIAGRPFVDFLIENCLRFGFRNLLLLSNDVGEHLTNCVATVRRGLPSGVTLELHIAPEARKNSAAVRSAAQQLHRRFFLLDGDCLLDFNWLDLMVAASLPAPPLLIAARRIGTQSPEPVRRGVYLVDKQILAALPGDMNVGELLANLGPDRCAVREYDCRFVDVADPASYGAAEAELSKRRARPAVFFDRDGTINVDTGYAFKPDDLAFTPEAIAAVKRVNDAGHYAFLVTNQSGIARGYYTESDMHAFHVHMQRCLRAAGAHFDDIRYCPYHPEGTVARYARSSDCRKPAPGMLLDLLASWPVDPASSFMIGDTEDDMRAAQAAGLRGVRYAGGDLDRLIAHELHTYLLDKPRLTAS